MIDRIRTIERDMTICYKQTVTMKINRRENMKKQVL